MATKQAQPQASPTPQYDAPFQGAFAAYRAAQAQAGREYREGGQ
jgi:hypothetical protein